VKSCSIDALANCSILNSPAHEGVPAPAANSSEEGASVEVAFSAARLFHVFFLQNGRRREKKKIPQTNILSFQWSDLSPSWLQTDRHTSPLQISSACLPSGVSCD